MDTPAVPLPRDAREREILDKLVIIRDKLLLLKQDRTTYIRSQDVLPLYEETLEEVKKLNSVRKETGINEENRRKFLSPPLCFLFAFTHHVSQWTRFSRPASSYFRSSTSPLAETTRPPPPTLSHLPSSCPLVRRSGHDIRRIRD